jgi:N-acetyltransferase 10
MLVLQDFEALTPNLLARTVETIEGGGIIVLLLSSLTSLQQLHTMAMDVHARYRTSAHQDVVCRFNERFLLSLTSCQACLMIDDKLNVIPIVNQTIEPVSVPGAELSLTHGADIDPELKTLVRSLEGTEPVHSLVALCKTLDQAKALLKFVEVLTEKTFKYTVSLTAARGRGKSAALGLAIVAAIGYSYSNVLVTSPSPENLKTLFEFILKGLEAIHFQNHVDYEIIYSSNNDHNKAIVKINVFRHHRQCVQYIDPDDVRKNKSPVSSSAAELVVIDEAAAIPLPIVKKFLGPHLVFMASTINGYEGTGRSLSLKLLKQLRNQSSQVKSGQLAKETSAKILHEISLEESIRYKSGDEVEKWLNALLCLDADLDLDGKAVGGGCPDPKDCELYYINRDTLFSYHETSEAFLQRLMALYVASHYKNSPNDLQMMSDAPAHHLFALLAPMKESSKARGKLPNVLCFIQVGLEGQIPEETVDDNFSRGKRASGDLIPWTVSQQFQDSKFASLSGARIIRIATNPNYQGMGYGSVAVKLLEDYYLGLFIDETTPPFEKRKREEPTAEDASVLTPRKSLPPLLLKLSERRAEPLNYMGVSFGLTSELFKFWKKCGYSPVYLRQTANELTGEHSCIVLKVLSRQEGTNTSWLSAFSLDFQKRFINLLSMSFSSFPASLALNVISSCNIRKGSSLGDESATSRFKEMTREELEAHITLYDLKRLELYSQQLVDYHMITDLLPSVAKLYFSGRMDSTVNLSVVQSAILLALGLQHKSVEEIEEELSLPVNQILGLFSRTIIKISKYLKHLEEKAVEMTISLPNVEEVMGKKSLLPLSEDLEEELEEAAEGIEKAEKKEFKALSKEMSQYSIKGSNDEWNNALLSRPKSLWKVKSLKPRQDDERDSSQGKQKHPSKKKFAKSKKFKTN